MRINILTLFPEMFEGSFEHSIIKRAIDKGALQIKLVNIRNFAKDKHGTVDDKPYGGGTGMLMMPEPIFKALQSLGVEPIKSKRSDSRKKVILTTPRGYTLKQSKVKELANMSELTIICGRYEGVDERIHEFVCDEEISIGDYVLSGGEIPAMLVVDGITRLLEGVLTKKDATTNESFTQNLLEYPQYTRPEVFEDLRVPEVLLSGNHQTIKKWREGKAKEMTLKKRPDLVQ